MDLMLLSLSIRVSSSSSLDTLQCFLETPSTLRTKTYLVIIVFKTITVSSRAKKVNVTGCLFDSFAHASPHTDHGPDIV